MPNNFGLMDPMQLGQSISNAFLLGAQQRAFSNYAQNPSVESARGVAGLDPGLGIELMDREQARAQAARTSELQMLAAQGDRAAMVELAGVDLDAWDKLADNDRLSIKARVDYIGQAALAVSQLPEEQRPQAWDAYVMQGAQQFPDLAQYRGQYSPEALQAALAQAGLIKDVLGLAEPKYMAVPPGGTLVNTRDPQAIQQFGAQMPQNGPQGPQDGVFPFEAYVGAVQSLGPQKAAEWLQRNGIAVQVQTPEQARQLPSGTPIILPDGSPGRVP